jgi:hypothetical protein
MNRFFSRVFHERTLGTRAMESNAGDAALPIGLIPDFPD